MSDNASGTPKSAGFFAGRESARDRTHVTSETRAFFYTDSAENRALPINHQPTVGQRRFSGYTRRQEVISTAAGYFEGVLPSRNPRLGFVYSVGFRWDLADPAAWSRAGKPDLTETTRRLLVTSVRQLVSQADPATAAATQDDVERRLAGTPIDIAGSAGIARMTNLTLRPDLPPDRTESQAWTFATLGGLRLPAADDVTFTVALTLGWRVHDAVTWHLERVNEPAGLCKEILARDVGLILRAFPHDQAADAQETARKQLVDSPLDVDHGLQVVLRSIRVQLGAPNQPVDLSSHADQFDTTLATRDPAVSLDATVDISWRVCDQAQWARRPIDDLPRRCQAEATRRLVAVTTHYLWSDVAIAQQYIDEHACRADIDVDGSIELRIVSVRLTPPAGLIKSGQELANAAVNTKIIKEELEGQTVVMEWKLKQAGELQRALDSGVHPGVIKVLEDPSGAAETWAELSAERQAERRMQFALAADLAKTGHLPTELAKKILAAQSALGIPQDAEPPTAARRTLPRPTPPKLEGPDSATTVPESTAPDVVVGTDDGTNSEHASPDDDS